MRYRDYSITISARHKAGYSLSAVTEGVGRVTDVLPDPPADLISLLAAIEAMPEDGGHDQLLTVTGASLFRWLMSRSETHYRVALDRYEQQKSGLRLCLSIDAPEINAWPWELLYDPQRERAFATSITTPLVRYLDRMDQFGAFADLSADLPLRVLLVMPQAADLHLDKERSAIERIAAQFPAILRLDLLDGVVTRARLGAALAQQSYQIVHISSHGAFLDGEGFVWLNDPDGSEDWVDGAMIGRLLADARSLKVAVLNACSAGKPDGGRAFQGLAPQLARAGLPALIAMQYPLGDDAAMAFAEEFYRRLCVGESAGRVDVAVTFARNRLSILHPGARCPVAPVLYTHAPDGVIFAARRSGTRAAAESSDEEDATSRFLESVHRSAMLRDDWSQAGIRQMEGWRRALVQAKAHYRRHLTDSDPGVRLAAQEGLALVRQRLETLDAQIARS